VRDWTQSPAVIGAIQEYECARFSWLEMSAQVEGLLPEAAANYKAAYEKMQAADRAYVVARNCALDGARTDYLRSAPRLSIPPLPRNTRAILP
jgi:hypothetical protein